MNDPSGESPPRGRNGAQAFGEADPRTSISELCERLVAVLADLHDDVEVREGRVDIRATFGGRTICRLVPYREVIHVQVGESPAWETRVRDEAGYLEAVDAILRVFLRTVSRRAGPR